MVAITNYSDFLHKQLEQKLPGILTRKYPNLPFANGQYIPATADLAIGAEYLTKEVMESFGEAAIFSETTSDLPTVSTTVDERGYRALTWVAGVKWTHVELENIDFAKVDVVGRRTQFLPRVFDEAIQKFLLVGSAKHGITGFFNNSQVPSTNSSYNANTGTADDALDFVNSIISGTSTRTNLTAGVAYLLVPEKLRLKWARLKITNTNVSVLAQILQDYGVATGGTLRGIVGINECRSDVLETYGRNAAGTNKDLVLVIPVDPMACSRSFNTRRPIPLSYVDGVYKQYYLQSSSEVRFDYPYEFNYVNITKLT